MVRIFKVRQLEERRRLLVARSEMYRQTLKLEIANIKFAAALLRRKYKFLRISSRSLWAIAPLLGFLLGRRRHESKQKEGRGGLFKLLSAVKLLGRLGPLFQNLRSAARWRSGERENITRFP